MNYYITIGSLNNKNGYLSLLTVVFGVITIGLSFTESTLYFVTLILFIVSLIAVILNKYKLKKLQQQIFSEYRAHLIKISSEDIANGINVNTFFSSKDTKDRQKMMVIYDAKLDLDNTQYINLLLACKLIGFDDVDLQTMLDDKFDINDYILKKIKSLSFETKLYGGFTISKSVFDGTREGCYWHREKPVNPADNGWRIIGHGDSEEYLNDTNNWRVTTINHVFQLCPPVIEFFDAPIGTELFINYDNDGSVLEVQDLASGKTIDIKGHK